MADSRKVNPAVQFGLQLPFPGYEDPMAGLDEQKRTVKIFRNTTAEIYWMVLPRWEGYGLAYQKGIEAIARTGTVVAQAVNEPGRALLLLPTTGMSGAPVATTEIETETEMARKGGRPLVGYRIGKEQAFPPELFRGLFKTQGQ